MDLDMSAVKRILKALDWQVIKRLLTSIDSFVLYTEFMAQFLRIPDHKWMLMEGSLSVEEIPSKLPIHNRTKTTVMYSGALDKKTGILEFLQAIGFIRDEKYEFWFTGSGNALQEIILASKRDARIKYLGFLPTRKDLLKKQQQATMLINMRLPSAQRSEYSFPSKLLEFMISGRPVLSPKLGGVPDEYYKYLVEIPSTTPVSYTHLTLPTICSV